MQTNKITTRLTMWKSVEVFPSFSELKKIAKKFYLNAIDTVFLTRTNLIYTVTLQFDHCNDKAIEIHPQILYADNNLILAVMQENYYQSTLTKYNFNVKMREEYFMPTSTHSGFIKYCYMSDLYNYIMDSVN